MPDTTHHINVCGSLIRNTTVFPDTVLQTLDRRVGKDDLFFGRELFEASVQDWSGIPVIYHPEGVHPTDFTAVAGDPETAARNIGGRLVGSVSNPRIVIPGGARLMAELDIEEDEGEIVTLWKAGKIFPSTAFTANANGDRLVSPPIPNHVLLFPAKTDVVMPGDPGAFVNTCEVSKTMTKKDETKTCNADPVPQREIEAAVTDLEGRIADKTEDAADLAADIAELRAEIDALKALIEGMKKTAAANVASETAMEFSEPQTTEQREVAELTAENEALRRELETLKTELEGQKAEAARSTAELNAMLADAKFNRIMDKLPPGTKATEEQVDSMRKAFDSGDVETLLNTVFAARNLSGATQAEGVPFMQSSKHIDQPTGVGDLSKPCRRG